MKRRYWLWLILGLALLLRWWRLEDWFHFTMDEELIAWRACRHISIIFPLFCFGRFALTRLAGAGGRVYFLWGRFICCIGIAAV